MKNPPTARSASRGFYSGIALAIGGTFLFALKSILIKLAFANGVGPSELLMLRMLLAAPFYVAMLVWLRTRPAREHTPSDSRGWIARAMALGFLGYYLASYLDLCGLEYISAQLERLTLFTYPTMVAVLAWTFLGESLGPRVILALTMSYGGIALMYGQESLQSEQGKTAMGVWLVLGSALSYSLYVLFAKPTILKLGSRRFTSWAMIGSTIFVSIHFSTYYVFSSLLQFPTQIYLYASLLAFGCTVIPSFMINEAIARIGATRTTVIGTVGPVVTMLLAIAVLSEPTSWQHFAGMAVAVGGVSLVAKK